MINTNSEMWRWVVTVECIIFCCTIVCGCETWTVLKRHGRKIERAEMKFVVIYRVSADWSWGWRIREEIIRHNCNVIIAGCICKRRNIPKLVYGYMLSGRRHVSKPRKRWTDQRPRRRNMPGTAMYLTAAANYYYYQWNAAVGWRRILEMQRAGVTGRNNMWPISWKPSAINTYQYPPFPATAVGEPAVPSYPHYRGVREVADCTRGSYIFCSELS